jgi:nitroreductase
MDFFELIQVRHSIRNFMDKPIDSTSIERILQAANCAPSAGNLQAYEIFMIKDHAQRIALATAARGQDFVIQAPLALVFCANPARTEWRYHERGVQLYTIQDATIACTFAMLAATELGLGSVWVGAFDDQAVMHVLGDPAGLQPVAILPIGYPSADQPSTPRRSLSEIVHELSA